MVNFSLLRTMWASIARCTSGAIAPIAVICMVGLVPMAGLAVDYVNVNSAKRGMQEAMDSALLAVARANPETQSEINAIAHKYFDANISERYGITDVSLQVSRVDETLYSGLVSGKVPLFFGGLFGADAMQARVDGQVRSTLTDLEVVLALDTTGSMAGSKLSALKSAASDFVDTMGEGDNVRIGLVPFARYVNIGMGNRNEPGFDIPNDYTSCEWKWVTEKSNPHNCSTGTSTGTCCNDGSCHSCTSTHTSCDYDETEVWKEVCKDYEWKGCVGSREEPYNTRDDNASLGVPGLLNKSCGEPLKTLTSNLPSIKDAIDDLDATGDTYIPAGMSMGWAVLSHRIPFTQGTAPGGGGTNNLLRAIVLMTDGANTRSKESGEATHDGSDVDDANAVLAALCQKVKEDDVTVFTIAFDVSDSGIKSLLRSCATSQQFAFDADSSGELSQAFEDIATALSRLRLSQ